MVDSTALSKTAFLSGLTAAMAISQLIFAIAAVDESWTTAAWGSVSLPALRIPLFLCAFATGAIYTLIPALELDWFGSRCIGRIHGTTMLGAIAGQTVLYNVVSTLLGFRAALWVQFVLCVGAIGLCAKLQGLGTAKGKPERAGARGGVEEAPLLRTI